MSLLGSVFAEPDLDAAELNARLKAHKAMQALADRRAIRSEDWNEVGMNIEANPVYRQDVELMLYNGQVDIAQAKKRLAKVEQGFTPIILEVPAVKAEDVE